MTKRTPLESTVVFFGFHKINFLIKKICELKQDIGNWMISLFGQQIIFNYYIIMRWLKVYSQLLQRSLEISKASTILPCPAAAATTVMSRKARNNCTSITTCVRPRIIQRKQTHAIKKRSKHTSVENELLPALRHWPFVQLAAKLNANWFFSLLKNGTFFAMNQAMMMMRIKAIS